jgi:hypothetical protein
MQNPHNLLYRLVEEHDVDRCCNTIRGSGYPVFLGQRMHRIANDEDRNSGSLADGQNRIAAGEWGTAEIKNDDIGLALIDQVEKMASGRGSPTRRRERMLGRPWDR